VVYLVPLQRHNLQPVAYSDHRQRKHPQQDSLGQTRRLHNRNLEGFSGLLRLRHNHPAGCSELLHSPVVDSLAAQLHHNLLLPVACSRAPGRGKPEVLVLDYLETVLLSLLKVGTCLAAQIIKASPNLLLPCCKLSTTTWELALTKYSGSLGNTQNQQTQQAPPTSNMFTSLLNNPQQQQTQQQGFGGLSTTGLTLGQSTNQQQTVPGVRIDTANIRGTTRFNDLHDELQSQIETMDKIIEQQVRLKNECYAIMPAHNDQLASIPNDVEFCRRKLIGLDAAMSSDAEAIAKLQTLASTDFDQGRLSFSAIDNLRLPPQYHVSGVWPAKSTPNNNQSQGGGGDIVGYFSSAADELSATLTKYQKNISDIELHLRNVEGASAHQVAALIARRNGASGSDEDAIRELAGALAEFEQSILHVAGKVGGVREGIQTLQLGAFPDTTGNSTRPATNGKRRGIY
jgi:hypothetical protein